MIKERLFKAAFTTVGFNVIIIGWVLIKIFTKYQEMISPIASYLLTLMIINTVIATLMLINKKKLIKDKDVNET